MQKSQFLFIISLVFAIIITAFAITNSEPVIINLFFYELTASQALVIFVSAALGAIIVTTLGLMRYIKLISEVKKLRKENETMINKIKANETKEQQSNEDVENIENAEKINIQE